MKISYAVLVLVLILPLWSHAQDCCDHCDSSCEITRQTHPDDPWTQGRLWLRQTGHFGKFYNCDCEEEKRFSPYICWKESASPKLFSGHRWLEQVKCDLRDIKQRIIDGSASCCGRRNQKTPSKSCHCNDCAN